MSNKVKMVDPPEGWKYGFPKALPDNVRDLNLWLIQNDYPRHLVKYWEDSSFGYVPCRFWEQEAYE